jgi:triosephosphate isomerase (TIM)
MRKKIVAGNWKMNLSLSEAFSLVDTLVENSQLDILKNTEVIIAPSFTFLHPVSGRLKNKIVLASQNCSENSNGAFTGDISSDMLKDCGVSNVIIGHSERRKYHLESDEQINLKLKKLISADLTPIFCIGETLEEREGNTHFDVIKMQLTKGLSEINLTDANKIIIAYEPVWAIGTGKTASPEQAQKMHAFIRNELKSIFNDSIANSIRILYGGSCNAQNAAQLFSCNDIDGGLIGGASLKAEDFIKIIEAAEKA